MWEVRANQQEEITLYVPASKAMVLYMKGMVHGR